MKELSASDLKVHCARVLAEVARGGGPYLITRRGKPVAQLLPVGPLEPAPLFGFARGSVTVHGDIVEPIDVGWEAAEPV